MKAVSTWRVVVIAGAFALLASAMTPAYAVAPAKKASVAKKRPPKASSGGGGAGPASLEWMITSALRP